MIFFIWTKNYSSFSTYLDFSVSGEFTNFEVRHVIILVQLLANIFRSFLARLLRLKTSSSPSYDFW